MSTFEVKIENIDYITLADSPGTQLSLSRDLGSVLLKKDRLFVKDAHGDWFNLPYNICLIKYKEDVKPDGQRLE